jgi:hypothetical protein
MHRLVLALALALALGLTFAGGARANHDHNLITPGTTVVDIGDGQTEKCASDEGGHMYHVHVHLGMPGMFAWEHENNPVSVVKTESATC